MAHRTTYSVPGMSCDHCSAAIRAELEGVAGVEDVEIDLDAKRVTVCGEASRDAVVAAIDEAGYEAT